MQPSDSGDIADQDAVFAFLGDPATHGLSGPVKRIDTHGAAVFLAGPDVYKAKRAVRFSYMDFSTLEKRKAVCEAEIAVNRGNAPDLYIEVLPITRDADGLHLGGKGVPVEWVVHLRRFDETATLDRLAEQGPLGRALTAQLAREIIAAHQRAPQRDSAAATAALRRALVETADELCEGADVFSAQEADALRVRQIGAFDRAEPLLLRRGSDGKVRRCHGDLHLRNIALIEGAPVLFDAIEFDEAIAVTDILYDLAFLLMDLWQRELRADANLLLNRYLWGLDHDDFGSSRSKIMNVIDSNRLERDAGGKPVPTFPHAALGDALKEIEGLALLPLFLSLRAAIRAKVIAAQLRLDPAKTHLRDNARSYMDAASRFLDPVQPCLIAVGGFSGTGKSVLAAALAPFVGAAPGALHIRSDIERKVLLGAKELDRLPAQAYRPEVSVQVYERLLCLAEAGLKAGRAVILDATYTKAEGRKALADLAAAAGVRFTGFWLEAPLDLLRQRVSDRQGDASDATVDVLTAQGQEDLGEMTWRRLDASKSPETLAAEVLGSVT